MTPLRLPDFFAVGPQRTGTTWLHKVLSGHVGLPVVKETDFFIKHFDQGLDWYLAAFRGCPSERPMGEIDPNYFGMREAYERIAAIVPGARIVVTLRDPTERAWSCYRVMRRDAWTRVGFEETVSRNEIIRESSRYAFHLENWQRRFGRERVLVMLYEDLESDPQKFLDQVCDFIGTPRIPVKGKPIATERVNAVTHAPRSRRMAQNARNARDWMRLHRWHRTIALLEATGVWRRMFEGGEEFGDIDPAVEERLRRHFAPEVDALQRIIGRDLSSWKACAATAQASIKFSANMNQ